MWQKSSDSDVSIAVFIYAVSSYLSNIRITPFIIGNIMHGFSYSLHSFLSTVSTIKENISSNLKIPVKLKPLYSLCVIILYLIILIICL